MRKSIWSFLGFLALGYLLIFISPIKHPIVALQLVLADPPASLPVPVDGVRASTIRNTWGAPRDRDRRHQGIDIFAKQGTPVRSTTEGLVVRIGQNSLGGNVVWVMGPGRQSHYYAHLSRFGAFKSVIGSSRAISSAMSAIPAMLEERRITCIMASTSWAPPPSIRFHSSQQRPAKRAIAAAAIVHNHSFRIVTRSAFRSIIVAMFVNLSRSCL